MWTEWDLNPESVVPWMGDPDPGYFGLLPIAPDVPFCIITILFLFSKGSEHTPQVSVLTILRESETSEASFLSSFLLQTTVNLLRYRMRHF